MLQLIENLEPRAMFDAGAIDPGFGTAGSITDLPAGSPIVLTLHDGRIVTVSGSGGGDAGITSVTLRHFSRDGAADTASDVTLAPANPYSSAAIGTLSAAVDSRDRIFVGVAGGIVCVLPNGKVDKSFGANGVINAPIDIVNTVVVQRDGKLVVGGNFQFFDDDNNQSDSAALVRLTSRGKRDASFGKKGIRYQGGPGGGITVLQTSTINQIAQDSQGRLIVARKDDESDDRNADSEHNTHTVTLRRVNTDGTNDTTLPNTDQRTRFTQFVTVPFSGSDPIEYSGRALQDFALDASDRMLIAVNRGDSPLDENVVLSSGVWRIKPDGTADTTFAGDGFADEFLAALPNGGQRVVRSVAVDSAGRILVDAALANGSSGTSDVLLARLNANGTLDTTFGTNGSVSLGTQVSADEATLAPNGSILVSKREALDVSITRYWSSDAPTVDIDFKNIRAATSRTQTFDLTIRDDDGVDLNTLGRDLRITGPNGVVAHARFNSVVSNTDGGKTIVARYKLAAPGGSWDAADDGEYSVRLINREIKDASGNGADGRVLGSFFVSI